MELRLLLSCLWLHWVPRLLPHTQASPTRAGEDGEKEAGQLTTVSSPQPIPFTGRIEGGLQDGHKVTVMGRVLSTDETRYGGLLSLSASALNEPGCYQLRMVHTASSKLPTPSSGDGKGPACQQCSAPPTTYL